MDARPFRPRGIENAVPALHQRHKSTGNLSNKSIVNGANPGFRGPAKRAAFGDVTNTTKHHHSISARDGGHKVHKAHSVVHLDRSASIAAAKENSIPAASKDALSTRPVALSTQNGNAGTGNSRKNSIVAKDTLLPLHEDIREAQAPRPRHPRHHQSQPQLKKPQPTLRKTQSRHLDSFTYRDASSTNNVASRVEELQEEQEDQVEVPTLPRLPEASSAPLIDFTSSPAFDHDSAATISSEAYDALPADDLDIVARLLNAQDGEWETLNNEGQEPNGDQDEDLQDAIVDDAKLPEAYAEPQAATADGQTTTLSETEEQWYDDDDEYCEEDDQGYTTAHSFRSRDMTGGVTTLLQPRVTSRVQRELDEARAEVEATRPVQDIEDEAWDVSMVAEYGDDIFDYLREMEVKMLPNPHYMEHQTEIQWSMRAVLMEWLVQVHGRFHLLPETLFLTVNYVDRFLSSKVVSIGKLQLVGATAILVASKYEEINCPSLQEIVYMVDNGYSPEEVLKAERFMLSMLGFELGWPGPMSFLRRVSKADDYDLDTRTLAKYFLELTIMDERFVASTPSFLAAGAHCLSRLILNKGPWTKAHVHYSGYTWGQLRPLVTMLIECCDDPDNHHRAIFDKYAEKKFREASLLVQSVLDSGFTLPHDNMPVRAPPAGHPSSSGYPGYLCDGVTPPALSIV